MKNVFSIEQVSVVLGMTEDEVEELLVKMKIVLNADSLTVCDENGYVMETFVVFKSHTEVNLLVTVTGLKAILKEVYDV